MPAGAAEHMKENLFTIGASDGTPSKSRSKAKSNRRPQAAGHPKSPHATEKEFLASLSHEQRAMWEAMQQQQQQQRPAFVLPASVPSTPPTVLRPPSLEPPPPPQPPSPTPAPSAAAAPAAAQCNPSSPPSVPPPGPLPDASEVKFELGASSPQRGSKLRGGGGSNSRTTSFSRKKGSPQASKGGGTGAPAAPAAPAAAFAPPMVPPASPAPPPKEAWAEPAEGVAAPPLHASPSRPWPASPAAAADAGPNMTFSVGEGPPSRSRGSGKRAGRRDSGFRPKGSPKPHEPEPYAQSHPEP